MRLKRIFQGGKKQKNLLERQSCCQQSYRESSKDCTGESLHLNLIAANLVKLHNVPCFQSPALRLEWFITSEDEEVK